MSTSSCGARGDDESESAGEWDDEDVGYQTSPIASVYTLLERHHQVESSQNDDSWWACGLMQRITNFMSKNDVSAARGAVREYASFQKRGLNISMLSAI